MYQTMLRQLFWVCLIAIVKGQGYFINEDYLQCEVPQCEKLEDEFQKIKQDNEPCDDFSTYACGDKSDEKYDKLSEQLRAYDREFSELERILNPTDLGDEHPKPLNSLKIERKLYKKCMKEIQGAASLRSPREKRAFQNFLETHQTDRIYKVDHNHQSNEPWTHYDLAYAKEGFGFAFYDIDVVEQLAPPNYQNNIDNTERYIQIKPTSDDVAKMADLLSKHVEKVNSGDYSRGKQQVYEELRTFISDLSKIKPYEIYVSSNEEKPLISKSLHDWDIEYQTFATDPAAKINWHRDIKEMFRSASRIIDTKPVILVKHEDYFHRLAKLLQTRGHRVAELYVHLRILSKIIGYDQSDPESREKLSLTPRVKGLACTPGFLVGAVNKYIKTYFPIHNQELLTDIFSDVKEYIKGELGPNNYDLEATSQTTREYLEFLDSSKKVIGYPTWLANETIVDNFYGKDFVHEETAYFEDQLKLIKRWTINKYKAFDDWDYPIIDMKDLFKVITKDEVEVSTKNKEITIPLRVFQEEKYPFFSAHLEKPFNYGSAGTDIAYELYLTWLEQISYKQNASTCIKNDVKSKFGDGSTNYEVATAYILALNASYNIWQENMPIKINNLIQFKKFGAIHEDQGFFLSFAQSVCQKREIIGLEKPKRYINMALMYVPGFNEAFFCDSSHSMHQKEICKPLEHFALQKKDT